MQINRIDRKRAYEEIRRGWWTRMVTINTAILTLTATQSRSFAPKAIMPGLLKYSWGLLSISLVASMLSLWAWSVSKLDLAPHSRVGWRWWVFRAEKWVRSVVANRWIAGLAYVTFFLGIILLLFFAGWNLAGVDPRAATDSSGR